ncbi:MAG: hypothetical protein ABFS37_14395, partial [Acidobacteriota bacterium]
RASAQNQDGTRSGSDLSVGVTYEGGMPEDPYLQAELRELKDQYLDAVERNLTFVRGYGRGIR